MGSSIDPSLRRLEASIEALPAIDSGQIPTLSETESRFVEELLIKNNPGLQEIGRRAVETVLDEVRNSPDVQHTENGTFLTEDQLKAVVYNAGLRLFMAASVRIGQSLETTKQFEAILSSGQKEQT